MVMRSYIGRCNMLISGLAVLIAILWFAGARADESMWSSEADEAHIPAAGDWWLDQAEFTEISPLTSSQDVVKLPADQAPGAEPIGQVADRD